MDVSIPNLSLVVLIGPSGSGKSTFARKHFLPTEVLSSDACRGMVCDDENDQTVTNQAFWLAYFEHVAGSYDWFLTFEDRLRAVTLEDVHAAARDYLRSSQRTVGWFVPSAHVEGAGDDDEE